MSIAGVAFAPGTTIDTAWLDKMLHVAPGYVVQGAVPRQNGSLVLAPPLYFATLPGMTVFATTASAILAGKYVTPRLHRRARNDFLAVGLAPGRDTLFAGIERLPPGEALVVRRDGRTERQPLAVSSPATMAPTEIAGVTEADLWRLLPEVVAALDDPVADPFLIAVHKAALAAREAGARELAIAVPSRPLGGRGLDGALRSVLRGELAQSEGTVVSTSARRAAAERILHAAGLQPTIVAIEAEPCAIPLASWIEKRGRQLAPLVAAQPAIREICLPGAVERLFARGQAEVAWRLLFYALWHRQHIERRAPETDVFSTLASRS